MNPNNWLEVEIGGKKRSLYYGMNSLSVFMDEIGIQDVNQIQEATQSLKGMIALVYGLCYVGDKINKNDIDYDSFDVGLWMDDMEEETLQKIVKKFESVQLMGKTKPQKKGAAKK